MYGDRYQLVEAPADVICTATSAAGAAVTATSPQPAPGQFYLITGYDITLDGAPSTGIAGGLQFDGATVYPIRLPASAMAPIAVNFSRAIAHGSPVPTLAKTVGITMAGAGGATVVTVALRGVLVTVG